MTRTGPSRAARVAAVAVPLCVLPSAVWRWTHVVGVIVDRGRCDIESAGELVYIASLSFFSLGAALLTLGLVRPWGQTVPRWIPLAGGWPVRPRAAAAVAFSGATVIALITAYALLNALFGFVEGPLEEGPPGCSPPGTGAAVLYAPLVAWAPLLYLVIHDYNRRTQAAAYRTHGDELEEEPV